jgi:D-inositol-3-phosphate glycosyltransferase
VNIVIPSGNTQRIQELHLHVLHTICSLIEMNLFSDATEKADNGRIIRSNNRAHLSVSTHHKNGKHVLKNE